MSNRQGIVYDANGLVVLSPGQLTFNGTTYDLAASSAAANAAATAAAALAAAAAAQATANAALPKAGGTMTGDINMNGTQKVTNLAAPTNGGDATNKTYVDGLVTGVMRFKGSTDCSGNPNYPAAVTGDAYVVSVAGKIGGAAGMPVEIGDVYVATANNPGGTQAAVGASWDILQYNLNGALLSANNLSDVQSAATSRTNLGLGSAATYSATAFAQTANNLSDLANAGTARTNLGLGSAATYADTAFAKTADNLSDLASAATARTNLGLGTAATYADTAFAKTANNLSDLANAGTARTNLGLGSAAQLTADTDGTLAANSNSRVATQQATKTYADGKLALTGGSLTGALGINRSGGAINATDLHIGTGNISIAGAVSTRIEPTIATPGNYARTLTFHPTYTGNTGVNAVALQTLPEVGAGASMPFLIGMLSAFIGTATKWIGIYVTPGGGTATTNYDAIFNGGGNVGIGLEAPTAKLHVSGTTKLGATGTALSQVVVYTPTLTPAASIAFGYSEQTFTVTGLATTDTVTINGPAQPAGVATVSARVSAANTIAVTFGFTGAGLTPTSGTYRIVAIRS